MIFETGFGLIRRIFSKTYFVFSELCCKCGCKTFEGDEGFLKKLLLFRVIYDTPFTPNSVYRCPNHKDYSSNHDKFAIDVPYLKGSSSQRFRIVQSALKAGFTRIGISDNFVHLDCNPKHNGTALSEVLWIYPKFNKQKGDKKQC